MELPSGPLPRFWFQSPSGTAERETGTADWSPLRPPSGVFSGEPPEQVWERGHLARVQEGEPTRYGPGRLGRQRWPVPTHGAETPWSIVLPREWRPGDFEAAYSRAWRIIRSSGFRHAAERAWVFRDDRKRWWVLHERRAGELAGPDGGPESFAVRLGRAEPRPLLAGGELGNAGPAPADLTEAFLADFGGVYGPLHWAFIVAAAGRHRLAAARNLRRYRNRTRALLARPEWAALREAVEQDWPHGGGLREVLSVLEGDLWNGPVGTVVSAYSFGFHDGATLAWLQAATQLAQAEAARNSGKVKLRAALRRIAHEEAAKGPLRPYALAAALVRERKAMTDRGCQLAALGLADGVSAVARMIQDEAIAAGLLQS